MTRLLTRGQAKEDYWNLGDFVTQESSTRATTKCQLESGKEGHRNGFALRHLDV